MSTSGHSEVRGRAAERVRRGPAAASYLLQSMAAASLVGGICGALVAGALGRIVMRILAVTSDPAVQGLLTDDREPVGVVSVGGSFALAAFGMVTGSVGGLTYLWVRRVLPTGRSRRVLLFALFTGTLGGFLFVHDYGSFDYSRLDPPALSVPAFIALPTIYGVSTAYLTERLDEPDGWLHRAQLPLAVVVAIAPIVVAGPLVLVGVVPACLVALGVAAWEPARRLWRSRTITAVGTALYVGLVLAGLLGLTHNILSVAQQELLDWPGPL